MHWLASKFYSLAWRDELDQSDWLIFSLCFPPSYLNWRTKTGYRWWWAEGLKLFDIELELLVTPSHVQGEVEKDSWERKWVKLRRFRSDQISRSVVSDSLQPHESQHARPPCPSPTPEIKLPTSTGSSKKQESSRKASISALLTMPKPLTVCITINCGKFWKRWEYQNTWPASWEISMQVRKQQLELDMEQQTGSK